MFNGIETAAPVREAKVRTAPPKSRDLSSVARVQLGRRRKKPQVAIPDLNALELSQAAPTEPSGDTLRVGSVPLLTRDEEVALSKRVKRGDKVAREHMIRANLRLVMKIARDYEHMGLPLADLASEGIIGLMKAVDRFEPGKGSKLSTYSAWWIKQQIRRAIANQARTIRLPVHVEGKLYRLGRAEARLRGILGREATDEELAGELGMNPKRLSRLRQAAVRTASLDCPLDEEQSSSVFDIVADEKALSPAAMFQNKVDRQFLIHCMGRLPEREVEILRLRFGLDGQEEQTLEEVGEKLGLTRERIRQLQNAAFMKLRMMFESKDPEN